jgi:hypothetical protein
MKPLIALLVLATAYSLQPPACYGQAGLRREPGIIMTGGILHEFTAGEAISAHDAVYLHTDGLFYKLAILPAAATGVTGVAIYDCASGAVNCAVQVSGRATATSDAAIAIGDRVGAPSAIAGRVKTVAGAPDPTVIVGSALTAATDQGQSIVILLGPGDGPTMLPSAVATIFYAGDYICRDPANAGKYLDHGDVRCDPGNPQAGFVFRTDPAPALLHQVLIQPELARTAVCPLGPCGAAALLPPCNAVRQTNCSK